MKSYILLFTLLIASLQLKGQSDTLTYLFLGHPYSWEVNNRVDERIEQLDLSKFDRIWLGGDVCSEAALDYSTVEYIDSLFDLGKPENHWTLGNHDTRNGNIEWITEFTKRPTYYAYHKNNVTTIVMDGNISPLDCENLNKQYELIKQVCDTIQSGYLFFLVHHGIHRGVPGLTAPDAYAHSDLRNWLANCYSDTSSYYKSIYPMLVEVKKRGVEVFHITGDVGAGEKSFYEVTNEGIAYFGSGINNSYYLHDNLPIPTPDLVLVFTHILSQNSISWEFVELNNL